MAGAHRQTDSRVCGATTVVTGQSTVFVEGLLWAVDGYPNTDGAGGLIPSGSTVSINGKLVIINGDHASADSQCIIIGPPHCDPFATSASSTVKCYG
jgi:uncharacterized Zn-binding protein involved in type VI secretion